MTWMIENLHKQATMTPSLNEEKNTRINAVLGDEVSVCVCVLCMARDMERL